MAGSSTANPLGHSAALSLLLDHAAFLHRGLYDSCETVRILSDMERDDLRDVAIASEKARAADLVVRHRAAVDRLIKATTEGVL